MEPARPSPFSAFVRTEYRFKVDKTWRGRFRWRCVGFGLGMFSEGGIRSRRSFPTEAEALEDAQRWADQRKANASPQEWRYTP